MTGLVAIVTVVLASLQLSSGGCPAMRSANDAAEVDVDQMQRFARARRALDQEASKIMKKRFAGAPPRYVIEYLKTVKPLSESEGTRVRRDAKESCPYPKNIQCGEETLKYRTIDGSCNNLENPLWGKAYTPLIRSKGIDIHYTISDNKDDMWLPKRAADGEELPSARSISMLLGTHTMPFIPAPKNATFAVPNWGQFQTHDTTDHKSAHVPGQKFLNLMACGGKGCYGEPKHKECYPITIPPNEDFDKFAELPEKCLPFVRSEGVPDLDCSAGPRQQLNTITHYTDASNVYGSTDELAKKLRDFSDKGLKGAKLQTSDHPADLTLKPLLMKGENRCGRSKCSLAGDHRADTQINLSVMHLLFVRQHNAIVDALHAVNPGWTAEKLYQEARKIVSAMMQHITYGEYLPMLFGKKAADDAGLGLLSEGFYTGYDPKLDATISNVFSTAANRFGHSMVPSKVQRVGSDGAELSLSTMRETYFNTFMLNRIDLGGVDAYLRAMAFQPAYKVDRHFTLELTKYLTFVSKDKIHDLLAINIQRGRDHGLAGYNAWRKWCGLTTAKTFDDLGTKEFFNDPEIAAKYKSLFKNVDDIDLYPAALIESELPDGLVGETLYCLIGEQFRRSRDGDRFWYENEGPQGFTKEQLQEVRKVSLAKVFCDNGDDMAEMQKHVMDKYSPTYKCSEIPGIDFSKFKE